MKRRTLLAGLAAAATPFPAMSLGNEWGAEQEFPTGWGDPPSFLTRTQTRVGNYSGGFEKMVNCRTIHASGSASPLSTHPRSDIRFGLMRSTPDDYMNRWPITGLLIARRGEIWFEKCGFQRQPTMRFTGWSMSKSVSSLLLGICIDKGLIKSLDDRADAYAPALSGSLHGETTLRNLVNMSTGLSLTGDQLQDNANFYPDGLFRPDSDLLKSLAKFNARAREQGTQFLYNDMAATAVGVVIRAVTGKSLSEFAEQALWQPMGAEADATWLADSKGAEFNCIGFAARLRDWARLGNLVAQEGQANGKQVVSRAWIQECLSWGEKDQQVRVGHARSGPGYQLTGYKALFWHLKKDGSRPVFDGFHGQRIYIDMPTQTVMVQTSVDHRFDWRFDSLSLFEAAADLQT